MNSAPSRFNDAKAAVAAISQLYETNTTALRVNTGPFGETIGDARPTLVRASQL